MAQTETIRAVVFQEEHIWVAQCLEHDIAVQAEDLETLEKRLYGTLSAELKASLDDGGEPFQGIDAAPKHFFDLWERCSMGLKPSDAPSIETDHSKIDVDLKLCA